MNSGRRIRFKNKNFKIYLYLAVAGSSGSNKFYFLTKPM
jgi:hypothetical protein